MGFAQSLLRPPWRPHIFQHRGNLPSQTCHPPSPPWPRKRYFFSKWIKSILYLSTRLSPTSHKAFICELKLVYILGLMFCDRRRIPKQGNPRQAKARQGVADDGPQLHFHWWLRCLFESASCSCSCWCCLPNCSKLHSLTLASLIALLLCCHLAAALLLSKKCRLMRLQQQTGMCSCCCCRCSDVDAITAAAAEEFQPIQKWVTLSKPSILLPMSV